MKSAFQKNEDAQAPVIFLLKDLCVSPYNRALLICDMDAIFILQNAFSVDEDELASLVHKAALDAVSLLVENDYLLGQFVFEEFLIEVLKQTDVQEEIELILAVLHKFYEGENFADDMSNLE